MHVVFQHHSPLPVKKYGGTERVLFWHMKELRRLGHEVTLMGQGEDALFRELGIHLLPFIGNHDTASFVKHLPSSTDVIHFFTPNTFDTRIIPYPVLYTIEGHGQWQERFHPNTVFVSRRHAEIHGSTQYVYNGLDLTEYPFCHSRTERKGSSSQWLFLAKASWKVKNLKDCAWAARSSKTHLHVAGGRWWWPSRYIHSYGMVDQRQKQELFFKTNGLLFPVRWHEPFGIAMIEAMSAGLPVIGTPYGSLPELIRPMETGLILNTKEELIYLLRHFPRDSFSPTKLRSYVKEFFSIQVMTQKYLTFYEKILGGKFLHEDSPSRIHATSPEELLPF